MVDYLAQASQSGPVVKILLLVFIAFAGTLVACAMIAAAVSFSVRRAQKIKHDENRFSTTEYIPHYRHREPVPVVCGDRIDRHIYYVGVMTALWFAGVGIMLVPIGAGALGTLDIGTQKLLAFALVLGSSLSLLGSSLGAPRHRRWYNPMRWWFPGFKEEYAYGVGAGGQIALGVALGVFGWTVMTAGSLIGTVTGLLTPILSYCSFRFAHKLWDEHKRFNTEWRELKRAVEGDQ